MAKFEYTGDEFADQAMRAIVSQQQPFYGERSRQFLGFSVRYSCLSDYRHHSSGQTIEQPGGNAWSIYKRGDRTMDASYLVCITRRGEAYQISGSYMVDETRIQFGDALLFALDKARPIAKIRGY